MLRQDNNKTTSPTSSQTNNSNDKQNHEKKKDETTTTSPTTSTSRDLGQDLVTPPKTTKKGKMATVHVLIADHPNKKKPLPLTIDVTQPAHVLVQEIAKLTHIPLAKLSVEYGGWAFPQDGLKRSCKVNYVSEGTNFVASKLKKDGMYASLLTDETN